MKKNKKIIVDLGNYVVKFKSDETVGKFSSKVHNNFEMNPEAYERVNYDGKLTFIGVGELDREYNKVAKNNIVPQVLYAINKAFKNNEGLEVNLCLLLPLNQLPQKNILKEMFSNKTFKFLVNDEARKVKINEVVVLPEAQVSYYSIDNPSKYLLLIDIGSKTINWIAYQEGKAMMNGTERLGIYDLYDRILQIENAKGEGFTQEEIEPQINRKRIIVDENVYKNFLKDILNRIKAKINIKNHDVAFTGGGSIVLEKIIKKLDVKILDNPQFTNVIGAYKICESFWG